MKTLSWNQSSIEDTQKYSPKDTFDAGLRNFQIANTAYPINHNKTIAPYKVSSKNLQTHIEEVWSDVDELLRSVGKSVLFVNFQS